MFYNIHQSQYTSVLAAAESGSISRLTELLAEGADPNVHESVPEIGDEYRDWGVSSTKVNGETPLMKALSKGFVQCVKVLIAFGADVNARLGWNAPVKFHTPIEYAYAYCGEEMVNYLIQHGANDVDEKPEYVGPQRDAEENYWGEMEKCSAKQCKEYLIATCQRDLYAIDSIRVKNYNNVRFADEFYLTLIDRISALLGVNSIGKIISIPNFVDHINPIANDDVKIISALTAFNDFSSSDAVEHCITILAKVGEAFRSIPSDIKTVDGEGVLANWIKENHPVRAWDEAVEEEWENKEWYNFWGKFTANVKMVSIGDMSSYNNARKYDEAMNVINNLSFCKEHVFRKDYALPFVQKAFQRENNF